ncbi:MAG: phage tail protein [Pyramidobacter porci]|uniref:phage tail protein n=1 Tax=Pyramidobacter porci TaxID=2605789 RepID=UPI002A747966|nr:phage tail protein [Pyramidobacter porci]MDY2647921.1 phage tail protein [Pyramidobacter porci]
MAKSLRELELGDLLPPSIAGDGNVSAAAGSLDAELRGLTEPIGGLPVLSRLEELAEPWLDHLAWQWHADVYEPADLTIEQKRYIVETSLLIHRFKGTRWAISTALKTLGFETVALREHWELNSRPYTFGVRLAPLKENLVVDARRFIYAYKPARSQLVSMDFAFFPADWPTAEELFAGAVATSPHDRYAWGPQSEALSAEISFSFDESPWSRHRYSEEGLFYDGRTLYDSTNEVAESIKIVVEKAINNAKYVNDVADSADSLSNILKIII